MKSVENLAFKGGGVLGVAYVGALKALEEYRLAGNLKDKNGNVITVYGDVKRVAGTSAGAICAALVALGKNAEELDTIMDKMKFSDFADRDPNFPLNGGICLGANFLNWMEAQVKSVFEIDWATFADLAALAKRNPLYKDLHVFSHQVATGRTFEFSAQSTPNVPISQAVRASMSIPIFYVPWHFDPYLRQAYPGDFIDGGVAFNYPVSAFDSGQANSLTLGFFLTALSYTTQGLLETLMHWVLDAYKCPQDLRAVAEAMFELIKLGPYDPSQLQSMRSQLSSSGVQGTPEDIELVLAILAAAYVAWVILQDGGDIVAALEAFVKEVEQFLGSIPALEELAAFLKVVGRWYSVMVSTLNTPTNFVFKRDAQRSIMVNNLGYSFTDFWLPECNKMKLRAAGYNSAAEYLSLIMYN
jgi:predicted acylesterase/phospholipase RssA